MALLTASCGPLEVRIGADDGVRPIRGSFQANLESGEPNGRRFQCGDVITATDPNQTYTVTSQRVEGGCQFNFDQEVELFNESDYERIQSFRQATRFLNRVELTVNQFDLYDENGNRFDVENRIRNAELWVNGRQVLDIEAIRSLPKTVVIEGEAIAVIKRAVRNKQRCTANIKASITILDTEQPRQVRCDYDSQPTYVLSSSEL
jgi:hypothetical protein